MSYILPGCTPFGITFFHLKKCVVFSLLLQFVFMRPLISQAPDISMAVTYELINEAMFRQYIVGNTVVGITRQSNSLYMLYFVEDGTCTMWKQNKIYNGSWWVEKDKDSHDFFRAIWQQYKSNEPNSLFHPENPRFGNATSLWYYRDFQSPHGFQIATKNFRETVIVAPGCAFPYIVHEPNFHF